MAQKQTCISHLGASITLRSFLPTEICPLPNLEKDFAACQGISPIRSDKKIKNYVIELRERAPSLNQFSTAFFSLPWRGRKIHWRFCQGRIFRVITFTDKTYVELISENKSELRIIIHSQNAKRIYELTFQYILATLGEQLEQMGYMRLHAVSWIDKTTSEAYLLLADSGAGKSTLAARLHELGQIILGDEVCLYRNGLIFSMPLPIATKNTRYSLRFRDWQNGKYVLDLKAPPQYGIRLKKTFVMSKKSGLKAVAFGNEVPFFMSLSKIVLGIGLPQMAEIYLRKNNLKSFLSAIRNRLRVGTALLSESCQPIFFDDHNEMRVEQIIEKLHPELSVKQQATCAHDQHGPFVPGLEPLAAESAMPNSPIATGPP